MAADDEPRIACRGLWKLFGPGAEAFLARTPAPTPEQIARAGFVPAVIEVLAWTDRGPALPGSTEEAAV